MKKNTDAQAALQQRLLAALAANRAAKLNFPGVFMGLSGEQHGESALTLRFNEGDWARDGAGGLHLPVLGVLLDVALGAVTRLQAGPAYRPATVHLEVQLTGAPVRERLVSHARFVGYSHDTALKHALSSASVRAGDTPVAHACGAFVMLELPDGVTQRTLPWLPRDASVSPLAVNELRDDERAVLRRFTRACRAASPEHPFIEQFWAGVPQKTERGARLSVAVAPHLGNRVGQVHGGLLLGLAAHVAHAAVPDAMRLSNISAWFLSPGRGRRLSVRASVLQQGRNVAVVRTQIIGPGGARVLEATSQHVRVH